MTLDHVSFVLISDRTGGARPGVFERGLATTDLLAPSFAIQLGDLIEGYSHDLAEIERQWSEIDRMFAEIRTPTFYVPGNHDVANPLQQKVWQERYGPTYSHFRRGDALFCLLDTQDPPADYAEPTVMDDLDHASGWTPRRARIEVEQQQDWNDTQPATVGDEQLDYWEDVLRDHRDARWSFVCMHMPLWQGRHPAWVRLRRMLGERPYSAFAGHVHNYRHSPIDGRSHIRLGPTGGLWVLGGPEGNFDHVTQVTLTDDGPVLANILLEGVRDIDGQPLSPVATRSVPIF